MAPWGSNWANYLAKWHQDPLTCFSFAPAGTLVTGLQPFQQHLPGALPRHQRAVLTRGAIPRERGDGVPDPARQRPRTHLHLRRGQGAAQNRLASKYAMRLMRVMRVLKPCVHRREGDVVRNIRRLMQSPSFLYSFHSLVPGLLECSAASFGASSSVRPGGPHHL